MSVDLFVYSVKSNGPKTGELVANLARKRWHTVLLDPSGSKESPTGFLKNHLIYGARTSDFLKEVRDLVRQRRKRELERSLQSEAVAYCELTASPSHPLEQVDGTLPPKVAKALMTAKTCYGLRTAAGRSLASVELQTAVWEMIGKLTGGLLEDPQEGSYFRMGPKGRNVLRKPEDSPIDVLGIYFRAAKAKGFPVALKRSRDNEEICFHPEVLSEAGLERFLKFTRNYRWPDPEYGSGMIGMILDEYRFKKGKDYARAKSGWLTRLEAKYGEVGRT
jgi:hypothetical protein